VPNIVKRLLYVKEETAHSFTLPYRLLSLLRKEKQVVCCTSKSPETRLIHDQFIV
jgi:hypothetical protein